MVLSYIPLTNFVDFGDLSVPNLVICSMGIVMILLSGLRGLD